MRFIIDEIVRRNRITNGIVYMQVTRGVAPRNHGFPKNAAPSLVVTARMSARFDSFDFDTGLGVITIPDIRWKRKDIKSISLLPNILGKQQAIDAGCYEAWQVDEDGLITEGIATNAWIVTADGDLVTRQAGAAILNGITRLTLLDVIKDLGITLVERPFTVAEALSAREAFLSSSNSPVRGITRIDGRTVGDGNVGPLTRRLIDALLGFYDRAADAAVHHPTSGATV